MKFLILTQYYPPEIGAPQVRLAAVSKELVKLGHEVEVVTAMPNHPGGVIYSGYNNRFYIIEKRNGIKIHRVWIYPANGVGLQRVLNYLSFTVTSLFGLFKAKKPDYLFVESPPLFLGLTSIIYCALRKVPCIFNVADLWPDSVKELGVIGQGLTYRLMIDLEQICYNKALYVNAVTLGIKEKLIDIKNIPETKVLFLPNGVDSEMFHPLYYDRETAASMGVIDKKVILYSGTLGYAQGLETAIHAFEILAKRGNDAVLVFLGDGSSKKQLVDMVKVKKLKNVVFIDPRQPEYVTKALSVSSAGLVMLKDLPLFKGARPSKLFPIMACGKPVLYSGAGEGADIIMQSSAGIVVPPEDPLALANAIESILNDESNRIKMGENGINYVKRNLNWGKITNEWIESFNR